VYVIFFLIFPRNDETFHEGVEKLRVRDLGDLSS
jgi:hypothetical protein